MVVFALAFVQVAKAEPKYFKMNPFTEQSLVDLLIVSGASDQVIFPIIGVVKTENPFADKRVNKQRIEIRRRDAVERLPGFKKDEIILYFENEPTKIGKYFERGMSFPVCVPGAWDRLVNVGGVTLGRGGVRFEVPLGMKGIRHGCGSHIPGTNKKFRYTSIVYFPMKNDAMAEKMFNETNGKKITVTTFCWIDRINAFANIICTISDVRLFADGKKIARVFWDGNKYKYNYNL